MGKENYKEKIANLQEHAEELRIEAVHTLQKAAKDDTFIQGILKALAKIKVFEADVQLL